MVQYNVNYYPLNSEVNALNQKKCSSSPKQNYFQADNDTLKLKYTGRLFIHLSSIFYFSTYRHTQT